MHVQHRDDGSHGRISDAPERHDNSCRGSRGSSAGWQFYGVAQLPLRACVARIGQVFLAAADDGDHAAPRPMNRGRDAPAEVTFGGGLTALVSSETIGGALTALASSACRSRILVKY